MAGGMSTDVTTTKRSDCNTSCRLPVLNINTARSRDGTVKAYTLSGNCSDQISSHLQRFQCLSPEDLAVATMVRQKDVLSFLSHSVPCVGCRRRYQNVSIFILFPHRLEINYSLF